MTKTITALSLFPFVLGLTACGQTNPIAGAVTSPSAFSVTDTNSSGGAVHALASKTRIVRNGQHKVIGIDALLIRDARYDVTFSPGGLSYDAARAAVGAKAAGTTFATSDDAVAAVYAIASVFNPEQLTNADVFWDEMQPADNRGDFQVPYAVTASLVPFVYGSWFPELQQWAFRTLFTRAPDEAVQSSVTWTFFALTKPDGVR